MHRFAPVVLATLLAATAPALLCAQAPTPFTPPQPAGRFTDPANLGGERVRPRDGRELPVDGGVGADGKPDNALGLAQMLRKLNTRASLMMIVAHPDDEDGGMLTYYSRGLGARVAVLTLTRGEGGQNQMTGDFEDALGLLRTQELLAADRYMGVDQMFGTEVDFGFTKTKAEAFQKWNHERVLYDAVRAVRIYRPLVIAAVFSGAVTDGHGQHQVSGQIAQEVFKAAGDPTVFPELTKEGILPWQPLKVYARVPFSRVTDKGLYDYATGQTVPAEFTNYVTGQTFTTEPTADVTINEGATDPLLTYAAARLSDLREKPANLNEPLSYVQFARIGLGLQRSQIGGGMRVPPPGRVEVGYHLYGSRVCAPGLPNPTPKLCGTSQAAHRNSVVLTEGVHSRAAVEDHRGPSIKENSSGLSNSELSQAASFFDGVDTSISSLHDAHAYRTDRIQRVAADIQQATERFDRNHPESIAPTLADALKIIVQELLPSVRNSSETGVEKENLLHELGVKRVQLQEALALALNTQVSATAQAANVITRSTPTVQISVTSKGASELSLFPIPLTTAPKPWALVGETYTCTVPDEPPSIGPVAARSLQSPTTGTCTPPARMTAQITRPYFYRDNIEQPIYKLDRADLRGAPSTPPALIANAVFRYHGAEFEVSSIVSSSSQPVEIIPPVSLTLDRHAQVVRNNVHSLDVDLHVESEDHPNGYIGLRRAPKDWVIRSPFRPLRAGVEAFTVSLPTKPLTAQATLEAAATVSGSTYTEGFRPVGYGTLPRTNFYTPSTLRVVPVDLKLPPENKRRIGYLPGTGDDVPAALASIGLAPTILKVSDLTPATLAKFDTVVLGVRSYNAHPDLHGAPTEALLDYARNGGNVVVQTQTPEFTAADAPYPLVDRNERVIDETAPVRILDPSSPLLTGPNRLSPADFNGWIEERGHGFLDSWDPRYTALTETHDPGAPAEHILPQAPQRGGLITVQLGKGRWTYCAFALYRQLPEAVPGAFRLMVNLITP